MWLVIRSDVTGCNAATHQAACEALKDALEALAVRELQLERKSREVANTEELCRQLQVRLHLYVVVVYLLGSENPV